MRPRPVDLALLLAALAALGAMLLGRLGHPLLWSDEADTAMFGLRVLEHGYPKVHGPDNVVYQLGENLSIGIKESFDAYIGTTWGHFYFAAPGLWWAEAVEDPWERTARVRLPFALAGGAGLAFWALAAFPALRPERRLRFAALLLALAAASVSLLLHLREVRYYALVVLLGGAIARVALDRAAYSRISGRRYAVLLTVLLFLLFHVFHPAYFASAGLLALERARAAWRHRAPWSDLAPFAASALLVAPFAVFFEIDRVAGEMARALGAGPGVAAGHAVWLVRHLLRHEWLAPALLCRAAVAALGLGSPAGRRASAGLLAFAAGYLALAAQSPLVYARYAIGLSPLLLCAFLLDAFALAEGLPARLAARWPGLSGRAGRFAAAAAPVLLAATALVPSLPELRGRLAELRTPVRGPLDFAIPHLLESEPRPQELVIATNYEEQAFMYYLGARTIIGTTLNNLLADRQLEPDVVIPRQRWPRSLRELLPFLREGEWEERRFPVRDSHWNQIPELSRSRFVPDPHRFATAATDEPEAQLRLYRRVESSKRTGTSSRP